MQFAPPILRNGLHHMLVLGLLASVACQGGISATGRVEEPTDADRRRYVRHQIGYALAFRSQGRLEAAERALRRALSADPDDARSNRLLAVVLEETGRLSEAQQYWAHADAIDPPKPLPPDVPLDIDAKNVLVVLSPPDLPKNEIARILGDWPDGEAHTFLRRRIDTRLPDAQLYPADPTTVDEARAWLGKLSPRAVISLRIDRAYCADSEKDGPFAVAWLRYAVATPDEVRVAADTIRHVTMLPVPPGQCVPRSMGRAVETVLADPMLQLTLREARPSRERWSSASLRSIFSALGTRISEELERGRARLATGRIEAAAEAFRRAAKIDPDNPDVRAYLMEAELTLEMAAALEEAAPQPVRKGQPANGTQPVALEPQLTPAQRDVAEQMLAEERRMRDELLAALVALEPDGQALPSQALSSLRRLPAPDPTSPGAKLARSLSNGGELEVRALYTPDGDVLARYFFVAGSEEPLLRESDSDGDGTADLWVGYSGDERSDVWEDRQRTGSPDLHIHYGDGGKLILQVSIDADTDGNPERIFRYDNGTLASEARDTNQDGRPDRFEEFDAEGFVVMRGEDLNGDGEVDVRSFYENGSLVRREITNVELFDQLLHP